MNVAPIIARLQEQLVPSALATVSQCDSADDAALQLKNNKPNAFVMFTSEGGGEAQGGSGAVTQRITYRFMVLLGIQAAGTKNMAKGLEMEALRDQVKDVLMGFTPEGAETPCVLVSSRVLLKDEEKALLFINCEFQTTYYIRKATA